MFPLPKWFLSCVVGAVLLGACTVPHMRVDPALADRSAALPVSGRDGWLIEQELAFGGYRSGPVSRGWTKGYDYPFFIRFSGAREKLRFAVRADSGLEAMVHCAGKLREQDLRVFRDYFDVNIGTTDSFAGTVLLDGGLRYDFYVDNLNTQQNLGHRAVEGEATAQGAEAVRLRPVWQLASGQRWPGTEAIGIEMLREGRVIGAVETVSAGRVWIDSDLPGEDRLLIASLASALLLRSGLAEHNDDL